MSIDAIQTELIENFELFDDWDDKYAYIIELGKKLQPLAEEHKIEQNIVKGCQSRVWLHSFLENGNVIFQADSDALIVRGIVSMLIQVLSGHTAQEIAEANLYFIDKIGLRQHLSMTRANGLASMIKQMKLYGIAFQEKN